MKSIWAATLVLASLLAATSCGGGSTSKTSSNSGGSVTPPTGGGTNNGGGNTPSAVTVTAGSTASGVDIAVPSGMPTLNAQVLGVEPVNSSSGSASNTGGIVQRGTQANVLLFGKGLGANLQISVLGPQDLSISNLQSIKSTTGLSGVQFTVNVNSNATPGARTVVLQDAGGHITTFTGGLEIQ